MADAINADDLRYLPSGTAAKKRRGPNVSSGLFAMVLSGLIAFLAFLYVTQEGNQKYAVAVVTTKLTPGQVLTSSSISQALVNVPAGQLSKLVRYDDRASVDGWIVTSTLDTGDLLSRSAVREPGAPEGLRAMSIPIAQSRAVDGALRSGDRVDVVDTVDGFQGGFAAKNLEVLSVNSAGGGAFGGAEQFSVTVALSADDAVNINRAIGSGKFDILRSTGATPLNLGNNSSSGGGGTSAPKTP